MERARSLPLACPKYFHASPWFEGKNGGLVVVERRRARQEGRKPVISPAESALPSRVGRWPGLAELGGLASLGASDRRAPVPAAADSAKYTSGGTSFVCNYQKMLSVLSSLLFNTQEEEH